MLKEVVLGSVWMESYRSLSSYCITAVIVGGCVVGA
jgi:hypothetical protein